jgi:hypothetical protein
MLNVQLSESYTLIGSSYSPCQELCLSIRYCAGIQFRVNECFVF